MRSPSNNECFQIARLMLEMDPTQPATGLGGGAMTQDALTLMTINNTPMAQGSRYEQGPEAENDFSDEELKIAKRFIEILGSPDRARDLLDKVGECEECLGMIDDDDDASTISQIGAAVPAMADMPMMNLAAQFNPSAGMGGGFNQ